MTKKEQLEKELQEIIKQEEEQLLKEAYPKFRDKYLNKYFKFKNSYSRPEDENDYWWVYIYINKLTEENLNIMFYSNKFSSTYEGISFQKDSNGQIQIDTQHSGYCREQLIEISKEEYFDEWNNIILEIDLLHIA